MNSSTLDKNYRGLHQTIGRVHIPAEPIHTAGRVYRHFVFKTTSQHSCRHSILNQ